MTDARILLFEGFETLDAFGPVEILGCLPDQYRLKYCSANGGPVTSEQGAKIETLPLGQEQGGGILLLPGARPNRIEPQMGNPAFMELLKKFAQDSAWVLTVCTGSVLLAATGLLEGKKATTNKMAFEHVCPKFPGVLWQKKARWVVDGKFYTASGVSAGIDMTLGFAADRHGLDAAREICRESEYTWHSDKDNDPFAAG